MTPVSGGSVMRIPIAVPASIAAVFLVAGCTSFSPPEPPAADMIAARQTVKLYDTLPPYSTPIGEINTTACDGGREAAIDKLLVIASQRGGNGIANVSCASEGLSFSCWKSTACTATAINVAPPPPPPPPPPKRGKPKPKKR
jgi:hypothetical protein